MSPHRTASSKPFTRALAGLVLPAATALLATAALPAAAAAPGGPAKPRPEYDAAVPAADAPRHPFRPSALERGKIRAGTDVQVDDATGLPTFLWAAPDAASRARSYAGLSHEEAARRHLAAYASIYDLADDEVAGAVLHRIHDTGSGVVIVSFRQEIEGVPVLRDEIRFAMDRDHNLVAISGSLRGRAHVKQHGGPQHFALDGAEAIALAYGDLTGAPMDARDLERTGREEGGYAWYDIKAQAAGQYAAPLVDDARARRVLFPLADRLEPAYHVEVRVAIPGSVEAASYAYVLSAVDGSILLRHALTASDVFSFRVWAETSGPFRPMDSPAGTVGTPNPTGVIDGYQAPFIAPNLVTLQNGPISTNDPWLPAGATVTTGNNAEAYADLVAPDGFNTGDLRATTTGANAFDRVYDTSQSPVVTTNQQMAAITQLFFDVNFLHDWYYDLGFNEAAGNAQTSNYGRGGIEGDSLRAEAQDSSGRNNANMDTPSDGGRPTMQMYIWDGIGARALTVNAPASIAGQYATGNALFGPTTYNVGANVVLVNDGAAPTTDACSTPFTNGAAMVGKIAFIDRGTCSFAVKVKNAQLNGAIGAIIANNAATGLLNMSGTDATITIPSMFVTQADGNTLRAQIGLNATLFQGPAIDRDGDVDNTIVAHEWGHYISNRLIGDALGLDNNQGGSMGEGWGDFDALLLTVRAEDAAVPANANFGGTYALASYAIGGGANGPQPNTSYYFGLRRVPYSTDFTKDPLTFQHIQNGVPLPTTAPIAFGADGSNNAEVHNSGEVWATMLWECYAALLRDTGRLTFDQAQARMRSYYVAAFKLTPPTPTYTEARDAMLAAAYANDPADYALFWQAFARRGIGLGAVSPDRYTTTNVGVVESYVAGGGLQVTGAALTDAIRWCDHDGFLDDAETGRLDVTVKNVGIGTLAATTATITTGTPGLSFASGNVVSFPALAPYQSATVGLGVKLTGASGMQPIDVSVSATDPALATAPVVVTPAFYGNTDDVVAASATDDVESAHTLWTPAGSSAQDPNSAWQRIAITGRDHRWFGPDARATADQSLMSPPLHVASGSPLAFTFRHRYSFEFQASPAVYFDGGVIEISTNGGASWLDIGGAASPGYSGTLQSGGTNPLQGRLAFVATSPSYPAFTTVSVSMPGPFAGPVLLRFRIGSDGGVPAPGWEIDDLAFTTLTDTPFDALIGDRAICLDSDHDGTNDLLDCAPLDATTWAPPTEALALTLAGASGASLAWSPPASPGGTATLYDVLRSTSASSLAGAVCQTTGTSSLAASDPTLPGAALFYLVRSRNACGSSLGAGSSGTPRTGPVCP